MSRPSSVLMKAATVPVFAENGITASMIFCCSLRQIVVGSITIPATPTPAIARA